MFEEKLPFPGQYRHNEHGKIVSNFDSIMNSKKKWQDIIDEQGWNMPSKSSQITISKNIAIRAHEVINQRLDVLGALIKIQYATANGVSPELLDENESLQELIKELSKAIGSVS